MKKYGKKFILLITFVFAAFLLCACVKSGTTKYTVTFDYNNGHTQSVSVQVAKDEKVERPEDPTDLGNARFTGWYLDQQSTNRFDFDTPITKNMTIYAGYNHGNRVTYVYGYNDENGNRKIEVVDDCFEIVTPSNPTRDGYTFLGWYLDSSLKTAATFPMTIYDMTTLYAAWQASGCEISFVTNSSQVINPILKSYGAKLDNIIPDISAKPGALSFNGWYLDSTFNTRVDLATYTVSRDVTLYAKWNMKRVQIVFIDNSGGTNKTIYDKTVNYGDQIVFDNRLTVNAYDDHGNVTPGQTINTRAKEGHTLVSWNYDPQLTNAAIVYPSSINLTVTPADSSDDVLTLYLYAYYRMNDSSVKLYANLPMPGETGGVYVHDNTTTEYIVFTPEENKGSVYEQIMNQLLPIKVGYTFVGYKYCADTQVSCSGMDAYTFINDPADATFIYNNTLDKIYNVYATWANARYDVEIYYNVDGQSELAKQKITNSGSHYSFNSLVDLSSLIEAAKAESTAYLNGKVYAGLCIYNPADGSKDCETSIVSESNNQVLSIARIADKYASDISDIRVVRIYINYVPKTYNILFSANGGLFTDNYKETYTLYNVRDGEELNDYAPKASSFYHNPTDYVASYTFDLREDISLTMKNVGYKFMGWDIYVYDDVTESFVLTYDWQDNDVDLDNIIVSSNVQLYAHWENIEYKLQGGSLNLLSSLLIDDIVSISYESKDIEGLLEYNNNKWYIDLDYCSLDEYCVVYLGRVITKNAQNYNLLVIDKAEFEINNDPFDSSKTYYYVDATSGKFVRLVAKYGTPAFAVNTYYSLSAYGVYEPLLDEPTDWETNYKNYYYNDNGVYRNVLSEKKPIAFEDGVDYYLAKPRTVNLFNANSTDATLANSSFVGYYADSSFVNYVDGIELTNNYIDMMNSATINIHPKYSGTIGLYYVYDASILGYIADRYYKIDDYFDGTVTIPDVFMGRDVKGISSDCFNYVDSVDITALDLPETVVSYGDGCFRQLLKLTELRLPVDNSYFDFEDLFGSDIEYIVSNLQVLELKGNNLRTLLITENPDIDASLKGLEHFKNLVELILPAHLDEISPATWVVIDALEYLKSIRFMGGSFDSQVNGNELVIYKNNRPVKTITISDKDVEEAAPNTVTVTFFAYNPRQGTWDEVTAMGMTGVTGDIIGEDLNATKIPLILADETFLGWYVDIECTIPYVSEKMVVYPSYDVTLYASVSENDLTFDGNTLVGAKGAGTLVVPRYYLGTEINSIALTDSSINDLDEFTGLYFGDNIMSYSNSTEGLINVTELYISQKFNIKDVIDEFNIGVVAHKLSELHIIADGKEAHGSYTLLETAPSDWGDRYTEYFEIDGWGKFVRVPYQAVVPDFNAKDYYRVVKTYENLDMRIDEFYYVPTAKYDIANYPSMFRDLSNVGRFIKEGGTIVDSYTGLFGIILTDNGEDCALLRWANSSEDVLIVPQVNLAGHNHYVRIVAPYAFEGLNNITSIRFGGINDSTSYVTTIMNRAFADMDNLRSVELGLNVSSIAVNAFDNSNKLAEISVNVENNYYRSVEGVLYTSNSAILVKYPCAKVDAHAVDNIISIPSSTIAIADNAINLTNTNIHRIVIRSSLQYIGVHINTNSVTKDLRIKGVVFNNVTLSVVDNNNLYIGSDGYIYVFANNAFEKYVIHPNGNLNVGIYFKFDGRIYDDNGDEIKPLAIDESIKLDLSVKVNNFKWIEGFDRIGDEGFDVVYGSLYVGSDYVYIGANSQTETERLLLLLQYGVDNETNTALIDYHTIDIAAGSISELFNSVANDKYVINNIIITRTRGDGESELPVLCGSLHDALGARFTLANCKYIKILGKDEEKYKIYTPGSLWLGNLNNDGSRRYEVMADGYDYFEYSQNVLFEAPVTEFQGVFIGWFEDAAYTRPVSFPYVFDSGSTTLYAKFGIYYTVSFETRGGTAVNPITVIDGIYENEIPTPTKTGFVFVGWYLDSNYSRPVFTDPLDDNEYYELLMSGVTFYAKWVEE